VDVSQSSISLTAGWNTIGYLPQVSTTTYIALSSILSSILIMKDGSGNVFWPAFGVDLIGILTPGKGYQINMSAPAVFFYPLL